MVQTAKLRASTNDSNTGTPSNGADTGVVTTTTTNPGPDPVPLPVPTTTNNTVVDDNGTNGTNNNGNGATVTPPNNTPTAPAYDFKDACTVCKIKIIAGLAFDVLLVLVMIVLIYRILKPAKSNGE